MKRNSTFFKSSVLTTAVLATLGSAPIISDASTFKFSFEGVFTMIASNGLFIENNDVNPCQGTPYFVNGVCARTPIAGEMTYNEATQTGTMTINPFSFFGGGGATATNVTLVRIGDGAGGAGSLVLGNMGFDWNGTFGIPVSTVWDASGWLGASCLGKAGGLGLGEQCSNAGALPASENTTGPTATQPVPVGPSLLAMTNFNTASTPGATLGSNPSGTLPIGFANTIAGDPMLAGPFQGSNANFDFLKLTVIEKDGQQLVGAPKVSSQTPAPGATGVIFSANVLVVFDRPVDAATVAAPGAFTLKNSSGNDIAGTVTPDTGAATQFTFNPTFDDNDAVDSTGIPFDGLGFLKTYTVTLDESIKNNVPTGNGAPLGSDISWSFTVQAQPFPQVCSGTVSPYISVGNGALNGDSNFTMLAVSGGVELGTNDVSYSLDFVNLNSSETGNVGVLTNELASPTAYRGFLWDAHHIRLFAPGGPYNINVDCTTAQLEGGTCAPNANPARNLNFTVPPGHIGAHMLFDWNVTSNIDVINVWSPNAKYDVSPDGSKNDIVIAGTYGGPAGNQPDPQGLWNYASTDVGGDTINGMKMIDGPFVGFNANFNLGPQSTCTPAPPPVTTAPENPLGKGFFGCSLTEGKVNPWQRADLGLLAGFLGALAFWRRRNRTNA
jgi:hypothetical protein